MLNRKCYMDALCVDGVFNAKLFKNHRSVEMRKMNLCEKYLDPDAYSNELYNDLCELYNGKELPNGEILNLKIKNNTLVSKDGLVLTSDYLGPSATEAFKNNVLDSDVGNYIKRCRIIGGHIIWPCHSGSINQAKGRVFDRMDITLAELKNYYSYISDNEKTYAQRSEYSNALWKAFERDKQWLLKFIDFNGFCDFFDLVGSFVDDKYRIIWFGCENNKKIENYNLLMENNAKAIEYRNDNLFLKD